LSKEKDKSNQQNQTNKSPQIWTKKAKREFFLFQISSAFQH